MYAVAVAAVAVAVAVAAAVAAPVVLVAAFAAAAAASSASLVPVVAAACSSLKQTGKQIDRGPLLAPTTKQQRLPHRNQTTTRVLRTPYTIC